MPCLVEGQGVKPLCLQCAVLRCFQQIEPYPRRIEPHPQCVYGQPMKKIAILASAAALAGLIAGPAAADPTTPKSVTPKYTPVQGSPGGYNPPKPKKGFRYPDCFCTDSDGKRIELGKTTCLRIGSEQVLARCGMSQNNPAWRRIQSGCPSV